jgi:hypothetical protein
MRAALLLCQVLQKLCCAACLTMSQRLFLLQVLLLLLQVTLQL